MGPNKSLSNHGTMLRNQMRTLFVVFLWCVSIFAHGATPEFAVGQVWAYNTRPGEEQSTVVIDKIDDDTKLGRIYHISVSGIHIQIGPSAFASELPHLPVSRETLKKSCTALLRQAAPNPAYLPGYRLWKEAFDAGHAGVYTISVAEIVGVTEATLTKPGSRN
jgi:hypothetical protein